MIVFAAIVGVSVNVASSQRAGPRAVPVTVTMVSTDASGSVTARAVEATRADGSIASVMTLVELPMSPTTRRVRIASGMDVFIVESSHWKSTIYDPIRTPDKWLRDAKLNCVMSPPAHENFLGLETISGYRSAKVSINRMTSWFALDYGCAKIQYTVPMSKTLTKTFHLESLVPGEPATSLFVIPSGYEEVPPSRTFGSDVKYDKYYYEHRPQK